MGTLAPRVCHRASGAGRATKSPNLCSTLTGEVRKESGPEDVCYPASSVKNKKSVFEQERDLTLEYVKTAKKILNKELDKKLNPLKKQKKQKTPKAVKVEEPT